MGLGSDAGSLQALYGFGVVRERELLQQAGLNPLDLIKVATTNSAEIAGLGEELCGIREGCVADLIVVDGNPMKNFKLLDDAGYSYYGMGGAEGGGVVWTIKAGQVFDAQALLREAECYVDRAKTDADQNGGS